MKIVSATWLGLGLLAAPSFAALAQDAGYVGPGSQQAGSSTVQATLASKDDTRVVLRGHIVSQVDKDHYLFADDTGQITVEIDHDLWKKQRVDANTPVELQGKVDIDHKRVGVEVKKLRLLSVDGGS